MADNNHHHYISIDLITSILKRLPSKSLLKFLTVSKSWYSLITNPNFIALHLNHHKSLSLRHENHHLFLLEPHFRYSFCHYGHRTCLPSPPGEFDSVAASYNGLICLLNSRKRNLLLWNPSINKWLQIQRLPILHGCSFESFTVVGLGFDSLNNDYKLVSFDYNRMFVSVSVSVSALPPYAQVYSVNGGVRLGWRRVLLPDTFTVYDLSHISEACIVDNCINWIVFRKDNENVVGIAKFGVWILTFDPRNDCFGEMQLPKSLNEAVDPDLCLAVIDDSLTVIHLCGDEELYSKYCAIVWKREEDGVEEAWSWKVLYRISLPYLYGTNPNLWDEEEGKVFITTSLGTLIVFNVKSGGSSSGFNGEVALIGGQAFEYTESLVLLDRCSGASWPWREQLRR